MSIVHNFSIVVTYQSLDRLTHLFAFTSNTLYIILYHHLFLSNWLNDLTREGLSTKIHRNEYNIANACKCTSLATHLYLHVSLWSRHWKPTSPMYCTPNSKVHGTTIMGPTWVLSAADGPHVDPMNLAIRGITKSAPLPSGAVQRYTQVNDYIVYSSALSGTHLSTWVHSPSSSNIHHIRHLSDWLNDSRSSNT